MPGILFVITCKIRLIDFGRKCVMVVIDFRVNISYTLTSFINHKGLLMSHTIEFLLYPGALGLDITGPLEVFDIASTLAKEMGNVDKPYQARFVAAKKGPIPLSTGLELVARADFKDSSPADTLLIPGGRDVNQVINQPEFMTYLNQRARQVNRIISICKGTFILAAAGLLDGKEATTHWRVADELAQQYPQVSVKSDAIFIQDDNIYTSAGVTAGIDLALAVVEEDLGLSIALEVARLLVLYFRRPGFQSQFSIPLKAQTAAGKNFARLHNWLMNNLNQAISVEQMADYAAMSERNFARVFKTETGMTPNKYLEMLRLDRAREIMIAGNESLNRIAYLCGFGREERLRRAFLRRFGVTPSQYRLHFMQS